MPGIIHSATCPHCDDTGWREVKNPIPGLIYCHCDAGKQLRKERKERDEKEQQAIKDAGLWDHPERWPW